MVDFSSIFKATYSGVPVYEMLCKGVAVMRRRSDSYLNATQILKVANFDKPQRTRILEREVQTGQHEKVQGGYGKYQGTWVPFERGKALAELYQVDKILAPILEFVKGDESPPLAPKHVTAASVRPKKAARETQQRTRKRVKHHDEDVSDIDSDTVSTPIQKPKRQVTKVKKQEEDMDMTFAEKKHSEELEESEEKEQVIVADSSSCANKNYAQKLLQYFMSSKSTGISPLLTNPPRDLDINIIIDDEGHTSLHWAAAMARIKVVKLMIENGADMYRVNYKGQTALMRSVLFTNNFDLKTFDSLLTLLRTTIFNIDKKDQTVFHHIATTAAWRGKIHASKYYMECLISKLNSNRSELISILNVQDTYGDTALTIAARSGNKRLVKLLIDAGASTEIANEQGMTSKDYAHRKLSPHRSDSTLSSQHEEDSEDDDQDEDEDEIMAENEEVEVNTRELLRNKIESMYSLVTNKINQSPPQISEVFDNFASSYEKDLYLKDKLYQKKKMELDLFKKRLEETKNVVKLVQDETEINYLLDGVEKQGVSLEIKLKRFYQYSQKETLTLLCQDTPDLPPSPPIDIQFANKLNEQLKELQLKRRKNIDHLIQLKCRVPPKKYQDYKRLISTCCNVAYENVDFMLAPLLLSFEQEEEETKGKEKSLD